MKKITLFDLIEEGDENFNKINSLLSEMVNTTSVEKLIEIRKKIMDILIDSQVISNETITNLFNEKND